VSRIRRSDPGCRGETLAIPELTLVTSLSVAMEKSPLVAKCRSPLVAR
jgi:hypothetical protein